MKQAVTLSQSIQISLELVFVIVLEFNVKTKLAKTTDIYNLTFHDQQLGYINKKAALCTRTTDI